MKLVEFLQKTIDGELSLGEQKKYMAGNLFPESSELTEAVEYLLSQMSEAPKLPGAIDICGTGGSGLKRINTSTISAFIVAASGVPVAKHGNNAATGRFGSFDLLEALDVPASLSSQELQLRFHEYKLAFLYARTFHPAMRHFGPLRSELGQPTFFNILGPLLSPIGAQKQLIGTPDIASARILAEVCMKLNKEHVLVVSGCDGLDEITLSGPTRVVELKNKSIIEYDIHPADFGLEPIDSFSEVSARTRLQNKKFAKDILLGRDKTRRTDLVLINAAAALYLAGRVGSYLSGYRLAKKTLLKGLAYETLENYRRPSLLTAIAAQKRKFEKINPSKETHKRYNGGLIAEIKKRSPSEGDIAPSKDIVKQAQDYQKAGAAAISVLTEPNYFGGSFEDLAKIKRKVNLPILCKDFISTKKHIEAAKAAGADIILLIASMLTETLLRELFEYGEKLEMQVLVEVHNQSDLDKALIIKPKIIGINSRNLHDFSLSPLVFDKLRQQIPKEITVVAESGIKAFADVPARTDGILVGTELMRHPFPRLKIKELMGKPIIKLCGIQSPEQAAVCEELGVDMIGINFVPRSHRKVSVQTATKIAFQCTSTITVGIFENQTAEEVNSIASQVGLDAIQLSGHENDFNNFKLPLIKTIGPGEPKHPQAFLTIIDALKPGSGQVFDHSKIKMHEPSLIAGGISIDVAKKLQNSKKPLGFDTASGIETDGQVDLEKIKSFAKLFA